jgi:hypothetical protein
LFRLAALKSVAEVFKKIVASVFQSSTTTIFTVSTFPEWILYSYNNAQLFRGPASIYNSDPSLFTLFKAEDESKNLSHVRNVNQCRKVHKPKKV